MRVVFLLPWLAGCQLVFPLSAAPDGSAPPSGEHNIAFITNKVVTGSFGGLAAADAICQQAAEGRLAPNTYVAWLSDGTTNAIDRLQGARGWVRPDGQPVADEPSELAIRGPRVPISKTETEEEVRELSNVWTGTMPDGTRAAERCGDWTSMESGMLGDPEQGGGQFTSTTPASCQATQRLYCFGTDLATELVDAEPAGPLWFVSSTMWSGVDSDVADDICSGEAQSAGFVGMFRAVVTRDGELISSRFDPTSNFYRVDGVLLGQLLLGAVPNTFPFLTANKTVAAGTNEVWTGGLTQGTPETTCSNWSVRGSGTGTSGFRHVATTNMFVETSQRGCDHDAFVYCAQDN